MSLADSFYSLVDLLKDEEGSDVCPIVPSPNLTRSLYAAFRQATDGDCQIPVTDASIEAWAALRGVSTEAAMAMYMQIAARVVSQINEQSLSPAGVAYLRKIKSCFTHVVAMNNNQPFGSASDLSDTSPTHQYASTPLSPGLFGALSTKHTHLTTVLDKDPVNTPVTISTPAHTPARKRVPSASAASRVRALAMNATGKTPAKTPAKASVEPSFSAPASSHLSALDAATTTAASTVGASTSIKPVDVSVAVDMSFASHAASTPDAAGVHDETDVSPPATPAPQRSSSGHTATTSALTTTTAGDVTPRKQPSTQSHGHTPHKSSRKSALVDRLSGVEAGVRELVSKVVQTPMRGPPARHSAQCIPATAIAAEAAAVGRGVGAHMSTGMGVDGDIVTGILPPISSMVMKRTSVLGDMAHVTPATAGLAPLIAYLQERDSAVDAHLASLHSQTHELTTATSRATAAGVPASALSAFRAAETSASVAREKSIEALHATSVLTRSMTSVSDKLNHLLNYIGLGGSSHPDPTAPTLLGALRDVQQRVVAVENAVQTIADAVGLKNVFNSTLKPSDDKSHDENEGIEESPHGHVGGEHLHDRRCRGRVTTSFMAKVRWCIRRAIRIGGKIALTFVYHMLMFLACLWVYRNYKEHFSTLASLLK